MRCLFNGNVLIVFFLLFGLTFCAGSERTTVKVRGVIDRLEDKDQAVVLIEELGEEMIVLRKDLPDDSQEDIWLIIKVNEEKFEILSIDHKRTRYEQGKAKKLLQELRERN